MANERDHDGAERWSTGLDNRLWRVEQRQTDLFLRLDKIEIKLEGIVQRQDERRWRIEDLENRLAAIEKRPAPISTSLLGESTLVRTVVLGLMALVVALATGQFFNFIGLFK